MVWVALGLVFVLVIMSFLYLALFNVDNSSVYDKLKITNPSGNLSVERAIEVFDESFIFYLLYNIKAYNLHNPPLSSDRPKIEVDVGDEVFKAVIDDGMINVSRGDIIGEDIIIKTSKEEVILMMDDKEYIEQSFELGKSEIVLVAGKTTLFAKGYLSMYTELTGKSITGNMIRIFLE